MSLATLQDQERAELSQLLQTGTVPELAEKASQYIETYQESDRADDALPTALDLLGRIQQLSPTAPIPPDLARSIRQVAEAIHSAEEPYNAQGSEDALIDLLYNLGYHLASRWPAVGHLLVEVTRPDKETH